MERSGKKRHYDETLLTVVIILVIIGLVMLYSTSAYNGEVKFHDPFYYLKKQGFATFTGILGMAIVSRIDYHWWAKLAIPGYLAAIALSVAVMLFGDEYNGSKRWLSLGPVSFQPSEFAKVAVILFLSCLVTKYSKRMDKFGTLVLMMLPVLPVVALVGASNLSTAIIILGIAVVLVFVASPRYSQFIWMGSAGAAFMAVFLAMESYRLERLAIWRHPDLRQGAGQQCAETRVPSGGPERYDLFYHLRGTRTCGSGDHYISVPAADLAVLCDCDKGQGSSGGADRVRSDGSYDDTGDIEYCGRHQFNSEYRDYASLYQLRRNLGPVPSSGNGACAECVGSGRIKRQAVRRCVTCAQ